MRWQRGETTGYVEGRCKGVNVCDYCAIQAAHENARMLSLDAIEDTRPQLLAIVGTGKPTTDPTPFYAGKREVMRALRARFGRQVEYVGLCEFTTGKGLRAGGLRRPHWNLFVKGIGPEDLDEAREIIRARWCANVPDAEPEAQYVEVLRDLGAAAQYVAMHFHKRDQAPPDGWRGQRFNASRGYFYGRTRREMRVLARADLQRERELWKATQAHPELDVDAIEAIATERLWELDARVWSMVATDPIRAEKLLAGEVSDEALDVGRYDGDGRQAAGQRGSDVEPGAVADREPAGRGRGRAERRGGAEAGRVADGVCDHPRLGRGGESNESLDTPAVPAASGATGDQPEAAWRAAADAAVGR